MARPKSRLDPKHELESLMGKLAGPKPALPLRKLPAHAKPLYLLTVDDADERSVVLIVRTGKDGVTRATIALPQWYELAKGWDGPHEMKRQSGLLPTRAKYLSC